MNDIDRKRFARYYPGYIEPEELQDDTNEDETSNNVNTEKKHILGYIEKIDFDKDKLINETISNTKTK
jgi:hypothetical protein